MTVRPGWLTSQHQRLVFVDTETSGLDPDQHEIWEVAMFDKGGDGWYVAQRSIEPWKAQPEALIANHYYTRRDHTETPSGFKIDFPSDEVLAAKLSRWLAGAVMVGINPAFDASFLRRFLLNNGEAPAWQYHVICAKTMAAAKLMAMRHTDGHGNAIVQGHHSWSADLEPPWSTSWLAEQLGIEMRDRHSAMGDVYLAVKFFEYATGFDFGVDWG
jgi:DNA polymerase III epsilon subunit-like protein